MSEPTNWRERVLALRRTRSTGRLAFDLTLYAVFTVFILYRTVTVGNAVTVVLAVLFLALVVSMTIPTAKVLLERKRERDLTRA